MMSKQKILFGIAVMSLLFSGCVKQEEPLNYNSISDFYGPWEMTLEESGDAPGASDGFKTYVNFKANGLGEYLKVYNSSYYPEGMIDLMEFPWSLTLNDLEFDIITYHVDYCSGNEIYLSRGYLLYKLSKISETLWDYLTEPDKFQSYQSVDSEGNVLNYKKIDDFEGYWRFSHASDSFGSSSQSGMSEFVQIMHDGRLINTKINDETGQTETTESSWRLNQNIFYWGILNYDIDYCKTNEISLSRSGVHLILTRVS